MPTTTLRPPAAPSLCRNCSSPGADATRRWLCPGCASDGAVRSCFSTDGRRIADPPAPFAEPSEYIEVPIRVTALDRDQPQRPQPRRPRRAVATTAAELQAQREADDAALL